MHDVIRAKCHMGHKDHTKNEERSTWIPSNAKKKKCKYWFISGGLTVIPNYRDTRNVFFILKSITCGCFLGDPSSIIHACFLIQWLVTSDICIISCGFMVCDKSSVHHRVMCEVVSCGSTNLFIFDMLRCWEDVGVRGAFEDPVQRFQLLLGEGICPKMFP